MVPVLPPRRCSNTMELLHKNLQIELRRNGARWLHRTRQASIVSERSSRLSLDGRLLGSLKILHVHPVCANCVPDFRGYSHSQRSQSDLRPISHFRSTSELPVIRTLGTASELCSSACIGTLHTQRRNRATGLWRSETLPRHEPDATLQVSKARI
jgi:hypothetical protein